MTNEERAEQIAYLVRQIVESADLAIRERDALLATDGVLRAPTGSNIDQPITRRPPLR